MKPIDFGKAALAGLLILILNLLATTAVIFAWSMLVEPGKPHDYYNALAPRIGAITGPLGGVILLFAAACLLGRRRPERNAIAFSHALWLTYVVADISVGLPMVPLEELMTPPFGLSLFGAMIGAMLGGLLADWLNKGARATAR